MAEPTARSRSERQRPEGTGPIAEPRRAAVTERRPLVLASRSPQRRAILPQLGVPFEARPADVEEVEAGPPLDVAVENAYRKAAAIEAPGATVLGVDTMVALGREIHGKPA